VVIHEILKLALGLVQRTREGLDIDLKFLNSIFQDAVLISESSFISILLICGCRAPSLPRMTSLMRNQALSFVLSHPTAT